jgi:hypothetical protein
MIILIHIVKKMRKQDCEVPEYENFLRLIVNKTKENRIGNTNTRSELMVCWLKALVFFVFQAYRHDMSLVDISHFSSF